MITRNGPKLSLLNIEAVKARHRGNYTCYARNKGGISQHSAFLSVNGTILIKALMLKLHQIFFAICFLLIFEIFFYAFKSKIL